MSEPARTLRTQRRISGWLLPLSDGDDRYEEEEKMREIVIDAMDIPIGEFEVRPILESPLFGDIEKGERDWEKNIGINPQQRPEEFLRKAILACSQQFNFWQDNVAKMAGSSVVWDWVREEDEKYFNCLNLPCIRNAVRTSIENWLSKFSVPLLHSIQRKRFWQEFNTVSNLGVGDIVYKKAILLKMLCDDVGFKVWNRDSWGYGCIDYNLLIVFDYFQMFQLPISGRIWAKDDLDYYRLQTYSYCKFFVERYCMKPSDLDGLLWIVGRRIRKINGDLIIPQVINEINY